MPVPLSVSTKADPGPAPGPRVVRRRAPEKRSKAPRLLAGGAAAMAAVAVLAVALFWPGKNPAEAAKEEPRPAPKKDPPRPAPAAVDP